MNLTDRNVNCLSSCCMARAKIWQCLTGLALHLSNCLKANGQCYEIFCAIFSPRGLHLPPKVWESIDSVILQAQADRAAARIEAPAAGKKALPVTRSKKQGRKRSEREGNRAVTKPVTRRQSEAVTDSRPEPPARPPRQPIQAPIVTDSAIAER